MKAERIRPGQVVVSRAGRDAGQCYVVISLRGDSRAAVADGTRRRVQNPKYKNFKHLRLLAEPDPELERKITSGERITDADIRRVLWVLVEKEGCQ